MIAEVSKAKRRQSFYLLMQPNAPLLRDQLASYPLAAKEVQRYQTVLDAITLLSVSRIAMVSESRHMRARLRERIWEQIEINERNKVYEKAVLSAIAGKFVAARSLPLSDLSRNEAPTLERPLE